MNMKSIVLAWLVLLNTVTVYTTEGKPKNMTDILYIYKKLKIVSKWRDENKFLFTNYKSAPPD